jgi:regulator of replication initiation timing
MRKKNILQQQKTLGTTEKTLEDLRKVLQLLVKENKKQEIIIQYLEDKLDRTNPVRGD